jgi:long-chain acyl-CoA synthetase
MTHFSSPLEAFLYWEENTPQNIFLRQPINRKYKNYTYKDAGQEIRKIAMALKAFNLPDRSHIALLSKNCAHWVMADLAIMMAGYISIPIYPTLNAASIQQILEHSEAKAIIVGKLDNYQDQKDDITNIPIIGIDMYAIEEENSWEKLVASNQPLQEIHTQQPNNLITIIYTSGTTGDPKGVMHTVSNFVTSANTLINAAKLKQQVKLFSYLPLAHIAERIGMCNVGVLLGGQITFPESLDTFAEDLEKTQPNIFFAVPRIWTKFQEKILEKVPQKKLNLLLSIPIINTILKKKFKKKLGLNNAQFIISGAAPLAAEVIKWYKSIDIHIMQVYGMTEDCCISHINLPNQNKIGTVGKVQENTFVKFTPEGEILIKNKCLLKGYYKNESLTTLVFDDDGYFKTGDIGEYDHDGFLTITGRVKDQFKTDKGKYISPTPIELVLSNNTDIEQICIVGTGIPQPIALVTLSELGLLKNKQQLIASLQEILFTVNINLEKHEKLEKIVVMKEDWTIDNGLCTPTLKVKRANIEKIHQPYYKQWFKMTDKVIFE